MTDDVTERLAARTLELVDVASESRDEAALAAHVLGVLGEANVPATDAGDTCIVAGALAGPRTPGRPLVVLAGHLDTVPTQGNRPGHRAGGAVHGLGASDMKAALAVKLELARDLVPAETTVDVGYVFFGREELPVAESALTPLLSRETAILDADLVLMMEPTDNTIHAGCLGNLNATWGFHGRSGHSGRPWTADNAIHRAARGIAALADLPYVEHETDGLVFTEAVSVTRIAGGIADNVVPDLTTAHVNYRYPPGLPADEAEARLRGWCEPHGTLEIVSNAPSAPVVSDHPLLSALRAQGDLELHAKQAWTPIAEFAAFGLPAVNFGPGDPQQAHRRDELVREDALRRSYDVLRAFATAAH
ncbi:MAG: succinyl-diaminopimelate desuccinylase [Solirubrobacteraceae bacterium]|nr:succinyl-diaminopimelate desuccinylase [Solirubrobacteraceae bacterium]